MSSARRPSGLLIVEDDELLLRALSRRLRSAGFEPHPVSSGARAMELLGAVEHIDCVLIDINLPDTDGFDLLARVRRVSDVPVIVVSVRHGEDDKVRALEGGADDYVTKPLLSGELVARVRAAIRRHEGAPTGPLSFDRGLDIDVPARAVTLDGDPVSLTGTEWSLLERLVSRPGVLQTHDQLMRSVWGLAFNGDSHYLRVYVAALRRKLGDDARRPRLISTQQGVGYRWIAQPR